MSTAFLFLASVCAMAIAGFVAGRLLSNRSVNMRDVVGVAIIIGFLGSLSVLFAIPIPKQNEQLIVYMLGQLSGFAGGIVAYHYGQKAGDAELDKARVDNTGKLADAVQAAIAAPAPMPAPAPDPDAPPELELEPGQTARAPDA